MAKHWKSKKDYGTSHHNSSKNENGYQAQSQLSDKEKGERTLARIALIYSILKKRLITDAELTALCADWDIAYQTCRYFWTESRFIVFLGEYEFQVSRKWFVEGADLETANDNIDFKRRKPDPEPISILLYTKSR